MIISALKGKKFTNLWKWSTNKRLDHVEDHMALLKISEKEKLVRLII